MFIHKRIHTHTYTHFKHWITWYERQTLEKEKHFVAIGWNKKTVSASICVRIFFRDAIWRWKIKRINDTSNYNGFIFKKKNCLKLLLRWNCWKSMQKRGRGWEEKEENVMSNARRIDILFICLSMIAPLCVHTYTQIQTHI